MKTFIFLICFSTACHAQQQDSIPIEELKAALIHMGENLKASHRQYDTGTVTLGIGIAVTASGFLWDVANDNPRNDWPMYLVITGSLTQLAGGLLMIDSHKHIGRAGDWNFTGNKFTINF